jgi:hypothetical protein
MRTERYGLKIHLKITQAHVVAHYFGDLLTSAFLRGKKGSQKAQRK